MTGSPGDMTDRELLDNYGRDKNGQWLGILFERYTLLLYGLCMKYLKNEEDAKDCVQQVYLKAITELNKYPVQYFKSWLYTVARNQCLLRLRNRRDRIPEELRDENIAGEHPVPPLQHLEKDRKLELLGHSLKELNTEQQQCVTLFYLEKKSYQQIAEQTGYSIMQVKSYIQNGKRNLKKMLEQKISGT